MTQLTQQRLKDFLHYDPETGIFTWKVNQQMGPRKLGKTAGGIHNGYVSIRVAGERHQAHRLAWLYMMGEWPLELDHRNLIRNDNRFENLRLATHQQNMWNQPLRKRSLSGITGVSWRGDLRKWRARIKVDGTSMHIGYFDSKEAAAAARAAHERQMFGAFARTA